jgi:cell division protein FtsI/penicillin-binding protein 2
LKAAILTPLTVKKIKEDIIYKAKLKKQYAKLKAREGDSEEAPRKSVYDREAEKIANDDNDDSAEPVPEATLEPHPDRVKMLEEPEKETPTFERRQRRTRLDPFQKEAEIARKKKEQSEAWQKAREDADRERTKKIAERERFRKAMAKARGGPNGQRKLGRESKVLLEKAQRLMGK